MDNDHFCRFVDADPVGMSLLSLNSVYWRGCSAKVVQGDSFSLMRALWLALLSQTQESLAVE